mgnify:CR=1 FL=1
MKRIQSACIYKTIHFQLKDGLEHEAAVAAVRQEAAAYAFSSHDVHLLAYDMTGSRGDVASTSGSYTDADTTILQFLGFNHSRSLFQKAEMRLAISMAMDRATYVSAYLMGHGEETQFPVSPVSSLYPQALELSLIHI